MFLKLGLQRRLVAEFADLYPGLWSQPTYDDYLHHPEYRERVIRPTRQQFGGRCYVCDRTDTQVQRRGDRLTVAHIVYPFTPFNEVVDAGDLTRSDVVLLCWTDHRYFDSLTNHRPFDTIDQLREFSVDMLDRMRVGRRTGEELPDDT